MVMLGSDNLGENSSNFVLWKVHGSFKQR